MVDPNKLMLLTPGIDRKTGEYLDFGVPATVVANYLREQRIISEKCDLNSILFLMTPAEDESKLNTLLAKLVNFKNLWDRDAALPEALPTICEAHRERYQGYTLQRICNEMHRFYREANIKDLQRQCFRASSFPELAMSPKDAYEALVANDVDYVPLEDVKGRISATLALIYPPGIGVVIPGERWYDRARRHVGLCRGRLRQVRLLPCVLSVLPLSGGRQCRDSQLRRRLPGVIHALAVFDPDRDLHWGHCSALADDGGKFRRSERHRPHRLGVRVGRYYPRRRAVADRLVLVQSGDLWGRLEPRGIEPPGGHGLEHCAALVGMSRRGLGGAEFC